VRTAQKNAFVFFAMVYRESFLLHPGAAQSAPVFIAVSLNRWKTVFLFAF
jgi:hypothetical protein